MRTRKERPIFRGLTIAAAGDLGHAGGGAQWTDANITRWVTLREGRFVRPASIGRDVTHLVCSGQEFRRGGELVQAALQCGKTCQIVTLDWLEDSMIKGRRLPEDPYSHRRALERERKRERMRLMVVKGLEKAVKEVNPNLYHLYRDHTFFQYEVVLTRDDDETGVQERYILSIFESNNSKPRLYWFVAKFYKKKGDPQPKIYRPSHAPGVFAREFALFESFFRIKSGIPWAQRLVKAGATKKGSFQYQPPTGGKPVGWVPAEYIPAELPDVAMSDRGVSTLTTVQPPTAAAYTNGSKSASSETARTMTKITDALVHPRPQAQPLITPAPSPRRGLATVATSPSQEAAAKHGLPASPPVTPPAFSWPTLKQAPSMIGSRGAEQTLCADPRPT